MKKTVVGVCCCIVAAMSIVTMAAEAIRPGQPARICVQWAPVPADNLFEKARMSGHGKGYVVASEGVYVCDNGDDTKAASGVCASITLKQDVARPIIASLASKAEKVGGSPDSNYSLYIDMVYMDGSTEWGLVAPFSTQTHDWQTKKLTVLPVKPVRSLSVYGLFRSHTGKASFKDYFVCECKGIQNAAVFDSIPSFPVKEELPGQYMQLRNVAANSNFVYLGAGGTDSQAKAFDVSVQWRCRKTALAEYYTVDLKNETDQDRALSFHFVERLGQGELVWFDHPRLSTKTVAPAEYVNAAINPVGSSGRLSHYPFGAVGCGKQGVAIGISPDWPAFFRVGCQSSFRELYLGYDIALTKEKPTAQLTFVRYTFDPALGFRAALAKYYQIFPKAFECRIKDQGVWMPFYKISKVEKPEDFGFRIKEGTDEVAWDDAHNVLTFRYTEPMTWWMSMPKEMPRTMDAALEHAKKLAANGDKRAQSLLTCGHYDQVGNFCAKLIDTPWCKGAVWSICDLPGLGALAHEGKLSGSEKYPLSSYEIRWSDKIAADLYPESNPGDKGIDGEYIDSSEGYVTALLNYRRDHFAGARCPLTFDRDSFQPAILRGLISYEYAKIMSDAVHARGKLMMANSTPSNLFWLTPVLDVCGTETDWNHSGKWRPQSDAALLYRRAMCGPKPYCFLMNTNFDKFSYEYSEKFMKRSLAYGLYPGYFSADAATGHYFSRPELYNRDRPLFKKYIPLCKRVAEAGWQPLTGATSSVEKVYIERFGVKADRVCFTLFNDSEKAETTTVTLDADQLKTLGCTTLTDLVSGKKIELKNGSFAWTLAPEDVAVFAK